MARQGSLCQQTFRSRREMPALGILCALLVSQFALCPAATRADEAVGLIDARLRFQWNSKDVRFWKVRLSVVDSKQETASISEVENHSASERTSGAFELSSDKGTLSVQPRHAMHGGAVQLRIRASAEAKLLIEVVGNGQSDSTSDSPPRVTEVLLAEIMDGRTAQPDSAPTDGSSDAAGKPTWSVARIAGDELRTENTRELPFYEPGSQLSFSVRTNSLVRHVSRTLTLEYSLYRVSHGETVSSHRQPIKIDSRGNSEPITINELAPRFPGVYEVRCQLAKDDGNIWSRLRRSDPPIVRLSQPIVVVDQGGPSQFEQSEPWRSGGVIRPSESSWSVGQWLPKQTTRLIAGASPPRTGEQSGSDVERGKYGGESISLIQPQNTFQATLPVITPGLPHKVTIRYPAARVTNIRVDVAGTNDRANPAVSFVLASDPVIGENDPWKTHTFVHYPTGDDQIWLTNLDSTSPAAFESVGVLAGPSHLTSRSNPEGQPRTVMAGLGSIDWVDSLAADVSRSSSVSACSPATISLYKLWVATDRLSDYVLANGMNGIMVPANSGARTWFDSTLLHPRRIAFEQDARRLAAFMRLIQRRNLDVIVGLEPSMLLSNPERSIREQPSRLHQLVRSHRGRSVQYNLLSPLVRENLAALVGELHQQCDDYACFAGIALQCGTQSHLEPLQEPSDDPGTLALFAQSNGQTVSPAHLRTWAEQQGQPALNTWLRDETRRVYKMVGESAPNRPLLMVMPRHLLPNDRDQTDQPGIELFAQRSSSESRNLVRTESFCNGPSRVLAKKTLLQQQLASITAPAPVTTGVASTSVAAILGEDIDDGTREPVVTGDQLIADVSRIIDRLEPSTLIISLPVFADRLHDNLAQTLRSFAATPIENMHRIDPIDPAMQTIHVSTRTNQGHLYVSMTSLAPWTSEVELKTSAPVDWVLLGEEEESADAVPILKSGGMDARVVVPPGRLITVKSATATNANLEFWSAHVSGGSDALEQIKQKVTLIVERIGILSDFAPYSALSNGGFEQSGGMGLVGWLHAQHPPGCVRIDDREFIEGKHSVLLTTDGASATRTWLVSDTIGPPRSGRLAVSLACRGELKESDSEHRLRVSIEATRDGEPIRYASEIDVPCNGQWGSREVVLETDGIESATVDSLRLTIDSLSKGRVWIDDVHLHDHFPTAKERAELQSQAFLAVQGLQRGNLTPSSRLLQNHWARHLLAQGPPLQPKPETKTVEPAEVTPGVAERIWSWLPRPLRF